jgi:hypothetical protein
VTPFDWLLFRRSVAASAVSLLVAAGIVAATDEVTSTLAMRAARLSAFAPFVAAVVALAVVIHARSRGELRALEALGGSSARTGRGAALGALLVGVVALFALASPLADASSLFPAVRTGTTWAFESGGQLARAAQIVVTAGGRITLVGAAPAVHTEVLVGLCAVPCLAPVALLAPAWSVAPMRGSFRALSLALSAVLVVALLHLIAGARVTAAFGALSGAPLALALAFTRRRPRTG